MIDQAAARLGQKRQQVIARGAAREARMILDFYREKTRRRRAKLDR